VEQRIAPSAELDEGSATVAGRIYDERGHPVKGAIVLLGGSGFWPARVVRTAGDGRFQWPGIPAGIYELRASKGPWVAPAIEGLILGAGASRTFGIKLAPGWALTGQILDAQSERPVRDAEVTVAAGGLGLHTHRIRSDRNGRFELRGLVGDDPSLYVAADGYVEAGPVRPAAGGPLLTIRLERASSIEGRVVDERGSPIGGVLVRALGEGRLTTTPPQPAESLGVTSGPVPPISAFGAGTLAFVGQVTTERDGTFRLLKLPAGPYTIALSHDDFAPSESESLRLSAGASREVPDLTMLRGAEIAGRVVDERGNRLEAIPVELRTPEERLPRMSVTGPDGSFSFRGVRGEASVTALPYDLPPARETVSIDGHAPVAVELTLSSTVYTMHGRVVDERGFGIGGALLTVTSKSAQTPIQRSAKSDPDGSFSVPALPAPPFELSAEHPAFSPTQVPDIASTDDVRVVMSFGVTLLGRVLDEWTGDGLGGVRVRLEGPMAGHTETGADGAFAFGRVPTGTYDVQLFHPHYEAQTRRVVVEPPRYVDRPQELETVHLRPGGTVEGEVLDLHGEPVADAEVTWGDPPRWDRAARTDVRGGFRLRGVPAGSAIITARHHVAGEGSSLEAIGVRPLQTSPGAFVRLPGSAIE
jgi:hypothetical protein